jgi:hypothetical protein
LRKKYGGRYEKDLGQAFGIAAAYMLFFDVHTGASRLDRHHACGRHTHRLPCVHDFIQFLREILKEKLFFADIKKPVSVDALTGQEIARRGVILSAGFQFNIGLRYLP